MNGYTKFLETEKALLKVFDPFPLYSSASASFINNYTTVDSLYSLFREPTSTTNFIFEEKDMMTLFNWFFVSKFEEGKEPIKSGFITSVDEESAREFIVRSLDTETFTQYKDGEYALVVIEVDSWEV